MRGAFWRKGTWVRALPKWTTCYESAYFYAKGQNCETQYGMDENGKYFRWGNLGMSQKLTHIIYL